MPCPILAKTPSVSRKDGVGDGVELVSVGRPIGVSSKAVGDGTWALPIGDGPEGAAVPAPAQS